MTIKHFRNFFAISLLLAAAGCSGAPGRVSPPSLSTTAGEDAVAALDKDGNGALHKTELEAGCSLLVSFGKLDVDKSGDISAKEINDRVAKWRESRVGEMSVMCEVTLDGQPLANAEVVLEPESFLGTNLQSGTGTSDVDGTVTVSMPGEYLADPKYPGMACGFYKIRVTSDSVEIPSKYNSATTLGCEVSIDAPWTLNGVIPIALKSAAE